MHHAWLNLMYAKGLRVYSESVLSLEAVVNHNIYSLVTETTKVMY